MTSTQTTIDNAKLQAKEKFSELMESYFGRYESAIDNKKLTIDMIEDFIGEAKAGAERIIKEAAEKALEAAEPELIEKKRIARGVAEG